VSADKGTKGAVPSRRAAKSTLGRDLLTSMEQALAYAKGDRVGARVTTVMVPSVDVKAIRGRLASVRPNSRRSSDSPRPRFATGNRAGDFRTAPPASCLP